jgi:RimJ/RimL family protein N-acetyltransferase
LIRPENIDSIRVAERLGERLVGLTEATEKPASIYRITREEWEGLPKSQRQMAPG